MSKVFDAPAANAEVRYRDLGPATRECDLSDAALAEHRGRYADTFMTAASPGIVCTTLRNAGYYDSHAAYVRAVAREMKKEYELIHQRGYVLQLDCPDLAMERHGMFQHASLREFQDAVALHIEAINDACAAIPADRIRLHVCWGNYDGPHDCDVPLADILPSSPGRTWGVLDRVRESASPARVRRAQAPSAAQGPHPHSRGDRLDRQLHRTPQVVCNRLLEAVDAVGDRERVIAGADCGFGTFAGWEMVAASVVWKKFDAMAEGARLASRQLWG